MLLIGFNTGTFFIEKRCDDKGCGSGFWIRFVNPGGKNAGPNDKKIQIRTHNFTLIFFSLKIKTKYYNLMRNFGDYEHDPFLVGNS